MRADAPLFETPATPSPSAPDVPAGAFSSPAQERAIMAPPPPPVPETERPRDGESFLAEVRALADAGYLEAAGQACTRALEQYPLSAELTYLQAVLLLHAGHAGEAADAARRAIYLDRTLAVAHLALGDALARLGHANDAARSFRVAHRLLSGLPEDAVVPGSGGESGARLSAVAAARLRLMERAS